MLRRIIPILKATSSDFSRDKCTLRAAALSYSTVFALPPLLILLIKLAGGGLVVGATGAFLSLQGALNAVWEIEPDPKRGGI